MRVFLSNTYNKNDYCDQTFYNNEGEIVYSVHPKHLRIVIWTGQITTLFRPPSMGRTTPAHGLFLKLTSDIELFKSEVAEFTVSGCHQNAITISIVITISLIQCPSAKYSFDLVYKTIYQFRVRIL